LKKTALLILFLALLIILISSSIIPLSKAATEWNQMYRPQGQYAWANSVIQTTEGGFAIAGVASSIGWSNNLYIVKTDSLGNVEWNQTYGGRLSEEAGYSNSLVQTSDGGYAIVGDTASYGVGSQDFYLVKTDSSGVMIWNQTYGDKGQDEATAVVQTDDGGYVIAGVINLSVGWLVKVDSQGNQLWDRFFSGKAQITPALNQSWYNEYAALTQKYGSNQTLLDQLVKELNYNYTKVQGLRSTQIISLVKTSDGGFAMSGICSFNDGNSGSCWVAKTDSAGNMQWVNMFGTNSTATSVIQTSDGGYALSVWSANKMTNPNRFNSSLVKTDSAGSILWSKNYETIEAGLVMNSFKAWTVIQTNDGGYALAGAVQYLVSGVGPYGPFFWIVKTDSAGTMQWNQVFIEPWLDYTDWSRRSSTEAHCVIQTKEGAYALAGPAAANGASTYGMWLVYTETSVIPEFSSSIAVIAFTITTTLTFILMKRKVGVNQTRIKNF
jgi:hypothetical protein